MKKCLRLFLCVFAAAIMLCLVGCGDDKTVNKNTSMQTVTDSIGRKVELPYPVTKAVVANAYNAELINAVGAIDKVIGVDYNIFQNQTGFHNKFNESQVIGKGQRELNYEKIVELNPQVLILTGNGSVSEAEEKLKPFGIKVLVCDAYYTDKFKENCELLGKVFGRESQAKECADYFQSKLDYIKEQLKDVPKKRVYFEYRRVGNTTIPGDYFYNMVEYSGADNIFKDAKNVQVDSESIIKRNPQYIVKVSNVNVYSTYEPPTEEEHQAIKEELSNRPGWDTIDAVKNNNIFLMSHYVHGGASKIVGAIYLAKYLYPERLPDLHPETVFKDWLEKYQYLTYIKGHTYPAYSFED